MVRWPVVLIAVRLSGRIGHPRSDCLLPTAYCLLRSDPVQRRPKRPKSEGPNVPIAPMLDMAFQLLTFFVLTYRAAPVEGQFVMNLLPAQPATAAPAATPNQAAASNDVPVSLRTLPTILRAGEGGSLARIMIEENE